MTLQEQDRLRAELEHERLRNATLTRELAWLQTQLMQEKMAHASTWQLLAQAEA